MRRRKRHRAALIAGLVILLGVGVGLFALQSRLRPLAEELAAAVVENRASDIINDAVGEILSRGEIDYDRMVLLEKDVDGNITALRTNMLEINRLKVLILNEIGARSALLGDEELTIALGSLIAPSFFTGRGPGIPVRVVGVASSDAGFSGQLAGAGINQTLHQIVLDVELTVTVLLPTGAVEVGTSTQIVVAETVLVGTVPGSVVSIGENLNTQEAGD